MELLVGVKNIAINSLDLVFNLPSIIIEDSILRTEYYKLYETPYYENENGSLNNC